MERKHQPKPEEGKPAENISEKQVIVIPVVQEQVTVGKETIETAKVQVKTNVREEEATVNIPVVSEQYEIHRVPVDKVFTIPPPVRYEGDTLIVPVIEEVVVVEKRYKVVEEVHLVKHSTQTPYMQQITLLKEEVKVERISPDGEKTKF